MPQDLKTIARLCAEFQRPYHQIRNALETAGVQPQTILNGCAYFDEAAVDAMASHLPATATTPRTIKARAKRHP